MKRTRRVLAFALVLLLAGCTNKAGGAGPDGRGRADSSTDVDRWLDSVGAGDAAELPLGPDGWQGEEIPAEVCASDCEPGPHSEAEFVSQQVPLNVTAGATFAVSFTMKNSGLTTWSHADQFRLGSQNPQDNQTWGTGRLDLPGDGKVAPGESHTFTAEFSAPAGPGWAPRRRGRRSRTGAG